MNSDSLLLTWHHGYGFFFSGNRVLFQDREFKVHEFPFDGNVISIKSTTLGLEVETENGLSAICGSTPETFFPMVLEQTANA